MRNTHKTPKERKRLIHDRISEAIRYQNHYTYKELGKLLEVSDKTIEKWVSPQSNTIPDVATIEVLAELLDVCPDYLHGRSPIDWKFHITEPSDNHNSSVFQVVDELARPRMNKAKWDKKRRLDNSLQDIKAVCDKLNEKYAFLNVDDDSEQTIWNRIASEIEED